MKKYTYRNHSQAADTRLRIEGRFISKEKAVQILGLSDGALLDKPALQELLNKHNAAIKQQCNIQNEESLKQPKEEKKSKPPRQIFKVTKHEKPRNT